MLVLTRKLNEKIVINDNIVIQIIKIGSNQVRIGIDAPKDVKIFREEVAGQDVKGIQDFNQSAIFPNVQNM